MAGIPFYSQLAYPQRVDINNQNQTYPGPNSFIPWEINFIGEIHHSTILSCIYFRTSVLDRIFHLVTIYYVFLFLLCFIYLFSIYLLSLLTSEWVSQVNLILRDIGTECTVSSHDQIVTTYLYRITDRFRAYIYY